MLDLVVEFLYVWVRRGKGTESVSFNNKSVGDFSEVRYHVREVTLRDLVFCGGVWDLAKHGLTRAVGRR